MASMSREEAEELAIAAMIERDEDRADIALPVSCRAKLVRGG